jgi:DNA polymerase III delta prime subunit
MVDEFDGLPNMLIHGPPSSGKYTKAIVLLNEYIKLYIKKYKPLEINNYSVFDYKIRAVSSLAENCGDYVPLDQKSVLLPMTNIHCEFDMNQPNSEKTLVSFINNYSNSKNIGLGCHKYIIIRHSENITHQTQDILRKILESKTHNIRFIFLSRSITNISSPIRSRLLCISNQSANENETIQLLKHIAKLENYKLTQKRISSIITYSKYGTLNNIYVKEALFIMEASFIMLNKQTKKYKLFSIYKPMRYLLTEQLYNELTSIYNQNTAQHNKNIASNNLNINYAQIILNCRLIIEKIYLSFTYDFVDILTGDLFHKIINSYPHNKSDLISIVSKFNHSIQRKHITHQLLQTDKYIIDLANYICGIRNI